MSQSFVSAHFTYAIPGYWLTTQVGERVFSPNGSELTEAGRALAHSFPCSCDKKLEARHLSVVS